MAGHSKWANIKHRKERQDKHRGKQFGRLIREVTVAAKLYGPNPKDNPRLRIAMAKSMADNIPKDSINRAIQRGSGEDSDCQLEEITYEGYAPGGVAVLVETMSDNRNRTVAEIRHAFAKNNASLSATGAVAYLFSRKGVIAFSIEDNEDENALMELAVDNGADSIDTPETGVVEVVVNPYEIAEMERVCQEAGYKIKETKLIMLPSTKLTLNEAGSDKLMNFLEVLEDVDDVQNIYTNAELYQEQE